MTTPQPHPQARPALAHIPAYRGGRPAADEDLKLSSNENPFDPLPGVLKAATTQLGRVNRYPDAGSVALYGALARHHEVEPHQLAAGTGSVAVLCSLLTAYCGPGDEVVVPWRSFEAYPIGVALTGATVVPVPLRADATHDVAAMIAAVTPRTKVLLVCTPNNPTGPVLTAKQLTTLLDAVRSDVLVVVDEAYVEFVRDPAAASGTAELGRDNVVVLRTFSKAYGLAGLRVGYGIGPAPVIEAVRRASTPFGVTDVAQAAAVASLAETDALRQRVDVVMAERERVVVALRDMGWQVPDAHGNFVWLPAGDRTLDVAAACEPVSVRPFADEGARVTIGTATANERLLEQLRPLDPGTVRM